LLLELCAVCRASRLRLDGLSLWRGHSSGPHIAARTLPHRQPQGESSAHRGIAHAIDERLWAHSRCCSLHFPRTRLTTTAWRFDCRMTSWGSSDKDASVGSAAPMAPLRRGPQPPHTYRRQDRAARQNTLRPVNSHSAEGTARGRRATSPASPIRTGAQATPLAEQRA